MSAAAIKSEGDEAPFVASEEWLDAWEAQCTPEFMERAKRYARIQTRKVNFARHVTDPQYAPNLVMDILGDTLLGVLAWDPECVSLKKHIFDAIKSRSRHDYVHATMFEPVRVHLASREVALEMERAIASSRPSEIPLAGAAVIDALKALAPDDRELHLLLDAYRQLVTLKPDVMDLTGLTAKQYAAARMRLHRLAKQLPANLRTAIGRVTS